MRADMRKTLLLKVLTCLLLPVVWQSAAGEEPAKAYREVYTWFNNSLDKRNEPGLQQISMDDGELVLFTCWRGLAPGNHKYLAKIYDALGQEVFTHPLSFPGDKDEWEAWTSYRFQPESDQSGMWRYEVFLDGQLIEKQALFVDAQASGRGEPVARQKPRWIAVKQTVPERSEHLAGTGTRGSVGIEVAIVEPDADPYVSVLQSEPLGLFDQAVLDAVQDWRFESTGDGSVPGGQPLFYWIHFGAGDVRIVPSSEADMRRGFPFRKVGLTDAMEAMALITEMNIAPGELAYFSVAAEFPTEAEAAAACGELVEISSWQPVWSNEGKWYCAVQGTHVVSADSIQSFIDTAKSAFVKNRGRLYGTYIQDQF